jgi:hypothetical protein
VNASDDQSVSFVQAEGLIDVVEFSIVDANLSRFLSENKLVEFFCLQHGLHLHHPVNKVVGGEFGDVIFLGGTHVEEG